MRVAVVGAGRIAQRHLKSVKELGHETVGVVDTLSERATAAARAFGGTAFETVGALLEQAEPQAAIICTPPGSRVTIVEEIAAAGIPMFMEKPTAFNKHDANKIAAAVANTGVINSVGFMWRWSRATEQMRSLVGDAETVSFVRSTYADDVIGNDLQPSWFSDKTASGGLALDQAIHILDLCRYIFGDIVSVSACGNRRLGLNKNPVAREAEEVVSMNLVYANDIVQNHMHSWGRSHAHGEITAYGRDYEVELELGGSQRVTLSRGGHIDTMCQEQPDDYYLREVAEFIHAVELGDPSALRSTVSDANKSLELALTINGQLDA